MDKEIDVEELFKFELGEECDVDFEEPEESDSEELESRAKSEGHWKSEKLKEDKTIAS